MSRRIPRPSPAMVVAVTALVVAVSGSSVAVAAVVIPKHSVGAPQLKKNAVTSSKVKAGAVTGSKLGANAVTSGKVKDGSLTGADVANGSLTMSDIKVGQIAGGVRAYGTVDNASVLVGTHPGIVSVTNPATGVYCLTLAPGIPAQANHAVVSVEYGNSNGSNNFVQVDGESSTCPDTTTEVFTFSPAGTFSGGVAFSIIVP